MVVANTYLTPSNRTASPSLFNLVCCLFSILFVHLTFTLGLYPKARDTLSRKDTYVFFFSLPVLSPPVGFLGVPSGPYTGKVSCQQW